MRLDPKYFNPFLAIVAVIAASFIAYATIRNSHNKQSDFKEQIVKQDSLQTVYWIQTEASDSISIADFDNHFVLLQFWSNWSDASVSAHQNLADLKGEYGRRLTVIAASVGLQKEEALSYIGKHKLPFYHVAGSRQFSSFTIPGVPAHFLYAPGGTLEYVSLGALDNNQIDSLKTIIDGSHE